MQPDGGRGIARRPSRLGICGPRPLSGDKARSPDATTVIVRPQQFVTAITVTRSELGRHCSYNATSFDANAAFDGGCLRLARRMRHEYPLVVPIAIRPNGGTCIQARTGRLDLPAAEPLAFPWASLPLAF